MNLEPRVFLQTEFEKRRSVNSRYSLRAFSRVLKLPSGRLSEFLSGKRPITYQMALKLSQQLGLDPLTRGHFLSSAQAYQTGSVEVAPEAHYPTLPEDAFHAIADWQHFAILCLMDVKGFESRPAWIAARLGISSIEARAALDRLKRLGLIQAGANGQLIKTHANIASTDGVTSAALQKSHRQSLEQAIEALESVPVEYRDITSITFAVDLKKLGLAKEMIKKFRRQLSQLLESGSATTEVYNLNIQLVPVTKIRSLKGKS